MVRHEIARAGREMTIAIISVTFFASVGPIISKEYENPSLSLLLGSTTLLASTAATPLCAAASKMYGESWVTGISCALFSIGIMICANSFSLILLFLGRFVVGVGLGGVSLMCSVILTGEPFAPSILTSL